MCVSLGWSTYIDTRESPTAQIRCYWNSTSRLRRRRLVNIGAREEEEEKRNIKKRKKKNMAKFICASRSLERVIQRVRQVDSLVGFNLVRLYVSQFIRKNVILYWLAIGNSETVRLRDNIKFFTIVSVIGYQYIETRVEIFMSRFFCADTREERVNEWRSRWVSHANYFRFSSSINII